MTDPTAREVLLDIVASKPEWSLPEPKAAVSMDTAVAAMEVYASRSVEEARRDERERAAEIADEIAISWERRADEATAPTRRMLCNEIATSHRLNAAAVRQGRYASCLPDAPERDGG